MRKVLKIVFLNDFFGVPNLATFIFQIFFNVIASKSLTSIQYTVPGFEPTTSWSIAICLNHQTMASRLKVLKIVSIQYLFYFHKLNGIFYNLIFSNVYSNLKESDLSIHFCFVFNHNHISNKKRKKKFFFIDILSINQIAIASKENMILLLFW